MSVHLPTTWVFLTGEYPPDHGGVADYTCALARALAASGDEVHVYAPPANAPDNIEAGITVHRLADRFGPRSLPVLRRALAAHRPPRAAIVQYVAQSFGFRGCNIPFAVWLRRLAGYPLFVMFHEVSVTVRPGTPWKYRLQALATRRMAREAIAAADAIFVSTPSWEPVIRRLGAPRGTVEWAPISSNVALRSDPAAVAAIRARYAVAGRLVGHFGTYREAFTRDRLGELVPRIAADHGMMLLGRGGERFAQSVRRAMPATGTRVYATGDLGAQAVADHLAACDVLVQPFEDGVTARRSSVTAALPLGVSIVTTHGAATEPMWRATGAVAFSDDASASALGAAVDGLLGDVAARAELAACGRALYHERFAIAHTVAALHARRASFAVTETSVA